MKLTALDASLKQTRTLPNGAASVSQAVGIQLDNSARGDFVAQTELLISAPALTVGELANAATMTYDVITSANADLSSPTVVAAGVLVQTGAGGAGAAAATKRYRPTTDVQNYIGIKITNSGAGNASGKTATAQLVF